MTVAYIPLTKGQWALVEIEDLPKVITNTWHSTGKYAARKTSPGSVQMHRVVLDAPAGTFVDHMNGVGTDNRRSNLRLCTLQENQRNRAKQSNNTSGFKGVSWNSSSRMWKVAAKVNGKGFRAYCMCKYDAATAYNFAAQELYKEFATYNVVPQPWLEEDV